MDTRDKPAAEFVDYTGVAWVPVEAERTPFGLQRGLALKANPSHRVLCDGSDLTIEGPSDARTMIVVAEVALEVLLRAGVTVPQGDA